MPPAQPRIAGPRPDLKRVALFAAAVLVLVLFAGQRRARTQARDKSFADGDGDEAAGAQLLHGEELFRKPGSPPARAGGPQRLVERRQPPGGGAPAAAGPAAGGAPPAAAAATAAAAAARPAGCERRGWLCGDDGEDGDGRALAPPRMQAPNPELPSRPRGVRPSIDVHAFYYGWYGNVETDKKWSHWNHEVLDGPGGTGGGKFHVPPDDIGASFYPLLGPYSSRNRTTVHQQLTWLREAGVGTISFSWWGRGKADTQGGRTDELTKLTLDVAAEVGLLVSFHVEPYPGRSAASVKEDLAYIYEKYGRHKAFYRHPGDGRGMFFLYDSYITPASEWASVLSPKGAHSIRGTDIDGIMIGLLVQAADQDAILSGGFDGFYTYFATDGFTYGSTTANWPSIAAWAERNRLLFIPSVGPGYEDLNVRPWNRVNVRDRRNGEYYDAMFAAAMGVRPRVWSVTSFNEVHEGTQIEPCVPKMRAPQGLPYLNYLPNDPFFYMRKTAAFVSHWQAMAYGAEAQAGARAQPARARGGPAADAAQEEGGPSWRRGRGAGPREGPRAPRAGGEPAEDGGRGGRPPARPQTGPSSGSKLRGGAGAGGAKPRPS
eukprot:tig00021038_g17575.t1